MTVDHPDILVEPATEDDLDALVEAWVDLAAEQSAYGSHVLPEVNRRTIRDVFTAHRFNDGVLVARADGRLVGFATFSVERGMFELDARRGTLSNLYVLPAYRDRGIGSVLLDAVEDALARRGVEVCTLEAMAGNEAARRFYRRQGYETGRVVMERRIEGGQNDTHTKEGR